MIARTWKGVTRAEDGERYLAYLEATGLRAYAATPGNRGVFALRRTVGDRTEFLLLSLWESEAAVRAFAGDAIDRAVFYPDDARYLIEADATVAHYDVAHHGPARGAGNE